MTIAICYLSLEGVVLGADSTLSATSSNGIHYLNHNQKLFELGEGGTVGALTWGLGSLSNKSYRTLLAELNDDLAATPPTTVLDIANRWAAKFWVEYSADLGGAIARIQELQAAPARTPAEQEELATLRRALVVGFCIAGYVLPDRKPYAYELVFDPLAGRPAPVAQTHLAKFWGAPNPILRLIAAADGDLKQAVLNSGHWTGSAADLDGICAAQHLRIPMLPIRDAVDFVHTCIHSTIKAMKFSDLPQICGGPIEIAVVTSDRRFRWVKHKTLDAAIAED